MTVPKFKIQVRNEGVAGRGEPPAVQGAKNLDSCSPLSLRDEFRRNDNVAVAATAKQKTLGETQG